MNPIKTPKRTKVKALESKLPEPSAEVKVMLGLFSENQNYKRIVERGGDIESVIRRLWLDRNFYKDLDLKKPSDVNSTYVEIAVRTYFLNH